MTKKIKNIYFDGRVIFDHLPKTAGQAVNFWLRDRLGVGCVTDNLIGNHAQLISIYGGTYSIISAHVNFEGNGFDPRYRYITCFREPIDRAVSFLYFVLRNHDQINFPTLWNAVDRFIKTEGDELSIELHHYLSNPYVQHLSGINGRPDITDAQKLSNALNNIEEYDAWGFFECLPEFLSDAARLIGIPAPKNISRVNVTKERPSVSDVSAKLLLRLHDLNALDIKLYAELRRRYAIGPAFRKSLTGRNSVKHLVPLNKPPKREYFGYGTEMVAFSINSSGTVKRGEYIRLSVDLSLPEPVDNLEFGIHITDSYGHLAFGTNTLLLPCSAGAYAPGIHRLGFYFVADLPDGEYNIGFAVADREKNNPRDLVWYEGLFGIRVVSERKTPSIGYADLPIKFHSSMLSDFPAQAIKDARGEIILLNHLNACISGGNYMLEAELVNQSAQPWTSSYELPLSVAYRWLDAGGNIQTPDSQMLRLPMLQLLPGKSTRFMLNVEAPMGSGCYQLEIYPVYGDRPWLDEGGFISHIIDVSVREPGQDIVFSGGHCSLKTEAGLRIDDAIHSTQKSGVLVFGPYMPLPAGKYYVQFYGEASIFGEAYVDVVANKGQLHLAKSAVKQTKCRDVFAEVELVLSHAVKDLETRIWVTAIDNIRLESIAILSFSDKNDR